MTYNTRYFHCIAHDLDIRGARFCRGAHYRHFSPTILVDATGDGEELCGQSACDAERNSGENEHSVESSTEQDAAGADRMPYLCNVCGRSFATRRNLKTHSTVHSGEKQHRCKIRGTSFKRGEHSKRHATVHASTKPYAGSDCGKRSLKRAT